ncbi:hypothetical protein ABK040_002078 [Willaertia magna]
MTNPSKQHHIFQSNLLPDIQDKEEVWVVVYNPSFEGTKDDEKQVMKGVQESGKKQVRIVTENVSTTHEENELIRNVLEERYEWFKLLSPVKKNTSFCSIVYQVKDWKKQTRIIKFVTCRRRNFGEKCLQYLDELRHKSLVNIFNIEAISESMIAIEMEYAELGDILRIVKDDCLCLPEALIIELIKQVSEALLFLHEEKNLSHGDLKPNNIFIRELDLDNNHINIALGECGWKQKTSHQKSKVSDDIYAFGVTLYQLMSLDFETNISKLYSSKGIQFVKSTLISNMQKYISYKNDLVQLVLHMLSKDSDSRPSAYDIITSSALYY